MNNIVTWTNKIAGVLFTYKIRKFFLNIKEKLPTQQWSVPLFETTNEFQPDVKEKAKWNRILSDYFNSLIFLFHVTHLCGTHLHYSHTDSDPRVSTDLWQMNTWAIKAKAVPALLQLRV